MAAHGSVKLAACGSMKATTHGLVVKIDAHIPSVKNTAHGLMKISKWETLLQIVQW